MYARFRYSDMKEAARDLRRTRSYANSMLGMSGVEVCPDHAVVQSTRNSVRRSGQVVLPRVHWEKVEEEIC